MIQLLLLVADPEAWKVVTIALIAIIIIGEAIAALLPARRP
jgi:hypothetical protein